MPPSENTSSAPELTDRLFVNGAIMSSVAEGGSRRPMEEMSRHLLDMVRMGEELESNDDYLGGMHEEMVRDLEEVQRMLQADAYGKKVGRALRAKVENTRRTLSGILEMRPEVSAALARRREKRWEELREQMLEWAVIPDGEERDDLLLSAFIYYAELESDMFEKRWDAQVYRDTFTDIQGLEPWDSVFRSPQDIARAFYRRRWLTEEQIDELLIDWD